MATGVRLPELNLVLLGGRLTRDPELFFTSSGVARCSFTVAVNRRWKDPKTNEWKDEAFFMPVVVWREQAERCKEKLKKGSPVCLEGRLRAREYEDKSGQKRSAIEVEARRIQFLSMPDAGDVPDIKDAGGVKAVEAGPVETASAVIEEVPF